MIKLKDILTEGMGDCYQAGGRLIMNFFGDKRHKLVHGMVNGQGALKGKRYGHCWVESSNTVLDHSNGRKLEIPTKVYYALGSVKRNECKYYTPEQAAKMMSTKKHWGPWEMAGGVVMAEDIPDARGEIGKRRIKIPSGFLKNIDLEENYKDGKKKGKSRPGRVKKSGASCDGSVTSLRAKAKKHGGEKGKMYHWCANMKKGKKK